MLTRQLATALRLGPDGWNHRPAMRRHEIELTGLTMGIVGFGGTGRAMARRAAAFGMLFGHRSRTGAGICGSRDGRAGDALRDCSRVRRRRGVLPLTRRRTDCSTRRRSPDEIVSVSCERDPRRSHGRSRADQGAGEGRIRGAALDVAPREPLPADSELWRFHNVVMTPHTAGASQFRAARNIDRFVTNLERLRAGQPLEGLIDKQKGY